MPSPANMKIHQSCEASSENHVTGIIHREMWYQRHQYSDPVSRRLFMSPSHENAFSHQCPHTTSRESVSAASGTISCSTALFSVNDSEFCSCCCLAAAFRWSNKLAPIVLFRRTENRDKTPMVKQMACSLI